MSKSSANRFVEAVKLSDGTMRTLMVYVCADGLVELVMTGKHLRGGPRRIVLSLSEARSLREVLDDAIPYAVDAS
jgi:hypothetical protein